MSFYARSTASIISEDGGALRRMISLDRRAKAKKHYIEKQPRTEQEQAEDALKMSEKIKNNRQNVLCIKDRRLALALS
jgi:hypothetical protein